MVMLGEYGHAISGPGVPPETQAKIDALSAEERLTFPRPEQSNMIRPRAATELMGPVGVRSNGHPNIFPNLWITMGGMQICLRLPRGPSHTEFWWFTIVPKKVPPPVRKAMIQQATHIFGPAGLLEQDDGENWSQSTRSTKAYASRKVGQALLMGLGHDRVTVSENGQKHIDTCINEHGQRWLYRSWTEWMSARDWAELKKNRS